MSLEFKRERTGRCLQPLAMDLPGGGTPKTPLAWGWQKSFSQTTRGCSARRVSDLVKSRTGASSHPSRLPPAMSRIPQPSSARSTPSSPRKTPSKPSVVTTRGKPPPSPTPTPTRGTPTLRPQASSKSLRSTTPTRATGASRPATLGRRAVPPFSQDDAPPVPKTPTLSVREQIALKRAEAQKVMKERVQNGGVGVGDEFQGLEAASPTKEREDILDLGRWSVKETIERGRSTGELISFYSCMLARHSVS